MGLLMLLLHCALSWVDSSSGIHSFLTFDSGVTSQSIQDNKESALLDFVWGASPAHISAYRASGNPGTVLSKYIPFSRDPGVAVSMKNCTGRTAAECPGLRWYQEHKPDFVLYLCDKVTPAWQTYEGEKFNPLIPLDVTNPAVVMWQVEKLVKDAAAAGYDAMAWDNYGVSNSYKACGAYRNGVWKSLYSGEEHDTRYVGAMTDWLATMHKEIKNVRSSRGKPFLQIPNYSLQGAWNSPFNFLIGNSTDGILSEAGFSGYGCAAPNQEGTMCTTGGEWEQKLEFVQNLQAHGVAYYMINEVGDLAHPGNWHKPCSEVPRNCITEAQRQYLMASYLLVKGTSSAMFISNIQCYGNWSACSECDADVGEAVSPPSPVNCTQIHSGERGCVWQRLYSKAVALLNNHPSEAKAAPLASGFAYTDLHGHPITSHGVVLPPGNATILYRRPLRE